MTFRFETIAGAMGISRRGFNPRQVSLAAVPGRRRVSISRGLMLGQERFRLELAERWPAIPLSSSRPQPTT